MKSNFAVCIIALIVLMTGCISNDITVTSNPTLPPSPFLSPSPSPSPKPPTDTLIPTAISTRQPTLEPAQSKQAIQALLRENVDCAAPCFWGVIPGQTTLEDAKKEFSYLRITLQYITRLENKDYYEFAYEFDNGLSFSPHLIVQDGIVRNLRVYITPELQQPGIPRSWLAYSPEMLIARYGTPSRVDFFLGRREPPRYSMQMYFDDVNLIIQYGSFDITFVPEGVRVCPVTDQYDSIDIWFGMNPENPPGAVIPLEKATSLTIEEFADLMVGDLENACFNLKEEAFP